MRPICASAWDGTFTRVGGQRDLVPLDFIPTHESPSMVRGDPHLTEGEALAILRHFRASASYTETARLFGVDVSTVSNLVRGKTWKHLADARLSLSLPAHRQSLA